METSWIEERLQAIRADQDAIAAKVDLLFKVAVDPVKLFRFIVLKEIKYAHY